MKKILALAAILAVVLPLAAAAEGHSGPVTWISFTKAKPGMGNEMYKMMMKYDKPMFDQMLADGILHTWGIATPIHHSGDDPYSHVLWATADSWAKIDEMVGVVFQTMMSRSPEEQKAVEEETRASYVAGSHHDNVVRHHVYSPGDPAAGAAPPRYIQLGFYRAKPGMFDDTTKLYKDYAQPVFDKLQGEGAVSSYGLYTADIHDAYDWTHVGWSTYAGLATRDAIEAGFDAFEASWSEEEAKAWGERFAKTLDMSTHRDQILMITYLGGSGEGMMEGAGN